MAIEKYRVMRVAKKIKEAQADEKLAQFRLRKCLQALIFSVQKQKYLTHAFQTIQQTIQKNNKSHYLHQIITAYSRNITIQQITRKSLLSKGLRGLK